MKISLGPIPTRINNILLGKKLEIEPHSSKKKCENRKLDYLVYLLKRLSCLLPLLKKKC
jgi:hypothetical protein